MKLWSRSLWAHGRCATRLVVSNRRSADPADQVGDLRGVMLARMYECRLNGYCAAKPCICNGTVRNASITGSQSIENKFKIDGRYTFDCIIWPCSDSVGQGLSKRHLKPQRHDYQAD